MKKDRTVEGPDFPDELILPDKLVDYDFERMAFYASLLSDEAGGVDWTQSASDVLLRDVAADPEAARKCWEFHMGRARLAVGRGFNQLISELPEDARSELEKALRG